METPSLGFICAWAYIEGVPLMTERHIYFSSTRKNHFRPIERTTRTWSAPRKRRNTDAPGHGGDGKIYTWLAAANATVNANKHLRLNVDELLNP